MSRFVQGERPMNTTHSCPVCGQVHLPPYTGPDTGVAEGEPTCRDCGLTREQIDWGWHSAPYEGQFATPPAPTPASEELRAEDAER